jgi:hypothetical protein
MIASFLCRKIKYEMLMVSFNCKVNRFNISSLNRGKTILYREVITTKGTITIKHKKADWSRMKLWSMLVQQLNIISEELCNVLENCQAPFCWDDNAKVFALNFNEVKVADYEKFVKNLKKCCMIMEDMGCQISGKLELAFKEVDALSRGYEDVLVKKGILSVDQDGIRERVQNMIQEQCLCYPEFMLEVPDMEVEEENFEEREHITKKISKNPVQTWDIGLGISKIAEPVVGEDMAYGNNGCFGPAKDVLQTICGQEVIRIQCYRMPESDFLSDMEELYKDMQSEGYTLSGCAMLYNDGILTSSYKYLEDGSFETEEIVDDDK